MSRCLPFPPPDYSRNGSFHSLQELLEMRRKEAKAERKRKKEEKRRKRMEGLEEGEILQKKHKRGEEEIGKIETEDDQNQVSERKNSAREDVKPSTALSPYNSYAKGRNPERNNGSWYSHGHHKHGSRTWTDFQLWPPICANGNLQFGEYFMPGSMQFPNLNFEFDDHDWLYRRNRPNDFPGRSYDVCHGNPQPHAVYFPHVDIYAYPYALPY